MKYKSQQNAHYFQQLSQTLNDKKQWLSAIPLSPTLSTTLLDLSNPPHFSQVLAQLVALAKENNLEFDRLKPLPPESQQQLFIQPLLLDISGSYPELLHFLYQLSTFGIPNTLGDLQLLATTPGDAQLPLQLTMTLKFYSRKPS